MTDHERAAGATEADLGKIAAACARAHARPDIRPIRHGTEDRVRAHLSLRMLSYYLSWHMQARLAPLLFTDNDKLLGVSHCLGVT